MVGWNIVAGHTRHSRPTFNWASHDRYRPHGHEPIWKRQSRSWARCRAESRRPPAEHSHAPSESRGSPALPRRFAVDYRVNRHDVGGPLRRWSGEASSRPGTGAECSCVASHSITASRAAHAGRTWCAVEVSGVDIRLINFEEKRGDPAIWRSLSLQRGEQIFEFMLLRVLDGVPLCLADHTLPATRFSGLVAWVKDVQSISNLFMDYGIEDYKRSDTPMTCRLPEKEEVRLLGVQRAQPLIVLEGRNIDKTGRPLEISRSKWPADCISMKI